jgi:hypothetical protein
MIGTLTDVGKKYGMLLIFIAAKLPVQQKELVCTWMCGLRSTL